MKAYLYILHFMRYGFLMLFFYAGLTKLLEGDAFYNHLYNSPLLPQNPSFISVLAWSLPFLEISIALSLLVQHSIKTTLIAVVGLLSLYAIYTAALLWWAPYQPCSCGGVSSLLSWEQHLLVNAIGIGLGLLGLYILRSVKQERFAKGNREVEDRE